ncbi:general secretion pathway protein L [Vibrio parahaemolyticus AQ3810]|nr:general secretion pathway protein L [Vibrio parahaemolyticus AQ3810]
MSEFLTVRLSSEQQSTIPWVVWSTEQQEVIASGELAGWEHLDELVSYAGQRQVIALLASNDVVLTQWTFRLVPHVSSTACCLI